jgi:DNA-binding transcriptional regulator GbsR (MarR family)
MLLLDDKGHAGWELAEALGMEDSNLSHLLKELKGLKFIFQGPPRKSTRPTGSNEHKKTENVKKSRKKRKKGLSLKRQLPRFLLQNKKRSQLLLAKAGSLNFVCTPTKVLH